MTELSNLLPKQGQRAIKWKWNNRSLFVMKVKILSVENQPTNFSSTSSSRKEKQCKDHYQSFILKTHVSSNHQLIIARSSISIDPKKPSPCVSNLEIFIFTVPKHYEPCQSDMSNVIELQEFQRPVSAKMKMKVEVNEQNLISVWK